MSESKLAQSLCGGDSTPRWLRATKTDNPCAPGGAVMMTRSKVLWGSGVLNGNELSFPDLSLIQEDITHSWYEVNKDNVSQPCLEPAPFKPGAYSWIKSVKYAHNFFEVGPLARMIINGLYRGNTSTMDRIYARTFETSLIVQLMKDWLNQLIPGPPPIKQKTEIIHKIKAPGRPVLLFPYKIYVYFLGTKFFFETPSVFTI
ncbi:MAG: hypothetical protein CVU87_12465 [Firmicutes bacterium HGW-Firmicutes-12]|jgi:Ni,Fe-hydrogenase I large subunit|nr:MAG: hypothetical protein CVU87_12465 [Firmicutes bacterium HGW-Firmicutes-12]